MPITSPVRRLLLTALLLIPLALTGCDKSPTPAKNSGNGGGNTAAEPEFKLTAADYLADLTSSATAVNKYKGKVVELRGVVNSIQTNAGEDAFVMLVGPLAAGAPLPGGLEGVACFTVDRQPFATLAPGQAVTIRGQAAETIMMPRVLNCQVVQRGEPTLLTFDAQALAAEVAKDPKAAEAQYGGGFSGKTMLVSGPLLKTVPDADGDPTTVLLGTPAAQVQVTFALEKSTMTYLKARKPGDTIKAVGQFNSSTDAPQTRLIMSRLVK